MWKVCLQFISLMIDGTRNKLRQLPVNNNIFERAGVSVINVSTISYSHTLSDTINRLAFAIVCKRISSNTLNKFLKWNEHVFQSNLVHVMKYQRKQRFILVLLICFSSTNTNIFRFFFCKHKIANTLNYIDTENEWMRRHTFCCNISRVLICRYPNLKPMYTRSYSCSFRSDFSFFRYISCTLQVCVCIFLSMFANRPREQKISK